MNNINKLCLFVFFFIAVLTKANAQVNLSYLSFNIRYDNKYDKTYSWEKRKANMVEFIKDNKFDIIGMQEVLNNQLEYLKSNLKNYTSIGVGRDDGNKAGEYCPILFNKDKFDIIESNTFWLSENPSKPGKLGWDAACPRILTWAKLKERKTNEVILVANTHLDHVGKIARINSVKLILDKLKDLKCKTIILSGDFNVSENNSIYRLMTNNNIIKLNDSYAIANKKTGVSYTFHNFGAITQYHREKIDFIFTSPDIKVISSEILSEKNNKYGIMSDHNPVSINIILK